VKIAVLVLYATATAFALLLIANVLGIWGDVPDQTFGIASWMLASLVLALLLRSRESRRREASTGD
jgi:hypothetical protein